VTLEITGSRRSLSGPDPKVPVVNHRPQRAAFESEAVEPQGREPLNLPLFGHLAILIRIAHAEVIRPLQKVVGDVAAGRCQPPLHSWCSSRYATEFTSMSELAAKSTPVFRGHLGTLH
jgi:hypothetical protein